MAKIAFRGRVTSGGSLQVSCCMMGLYHCSIMDYQQYAINFTKSVSLCNTYIGNCH